VVPKGPLALTAAALSQSFGDPFLSPRDGTDLRVQLSNHFFQSLVVSVLANEIGDKTLVSFAQHLLRDGHADSGNFLSVGSCGEDV
jgi:hypothetical protein